MLGVIVLSILQGISEFLPISSSGHLVLLNKFFGIEGDFLLLSVILHVATLFSVLIVLRKEIGVIIKNPFSSLTKKLIVATIPTVIIVVIFKKFFDSAFGGAYLPFCFMITAFVIVISEMLSKSNRQRLPIKSDLGAEHKFGEDISYNVAIFMGVMQGVAVLPGISRSGFTICGGLMAKRDRDEVARFSFLMSIPIILASLVLEIIEYASGGMSLKLPWQELVVGFLVALVVGIFSAKFMLEIVSKHSLLPFAIYLVGISILSFFVIF